MHKLLLVDQNTHSLNSTKKCLDWESVSFYIKATTNNFTEVVPLLEKLDFSLLVINIKNYNSSGVLLVNHIRQKSQIPIILIGGKSDFRIVRKALTYQVSDYLTGPVQTCELKKSLLTVKKTLEYKIKTSSCEPHCFCINPKQLKNTYESSPSIIDKVKQYIDAEMHQNITLKKISTLLHFNSAYLGQKFKQHENISFKEYLIQKRVEKAKDLLAHTDMKIYEIANKVGYTEIDWFYKKFKEYTRLSPNEYRNKQVETKLKRAIY
ncbi:helix-turn-helix domain-containing protein [Lederbergia galactosidilytica]|uniref:Uncharacterized protein n=1 Tax=Lederbergia galactosidilytica TaxID=217031 RepID=A0A177ZVN2_9BACI|nr:helix-turn-helix domain-containing protein [Lederbergia galactosidilytica]KRG09328.1 hypothetical protein ACA30_22080 [Virgibacillus soli]MBP1913451.1 YesN/AraC family two-component response regulator [Lederbergia galactosidilytica]OAK71380.1 hypothetical protein ABB05_10405 [Lederbergia galactosidilytica]